MVVWIFDDREIAEYDPVYLRSRIGMVSKTKPFPKSIYDNVAYGPRIHGMAKSKAELDDIVEDALRKGAIWDEVKDRLDLLELDCQAVNSNVCALHGRLRLNRSSFDG